MTFIYSVSKRDYCNFTRKRTRSVNELFKDLSTKCVSAVSVFNDKECVNLKTNNSYLSKNHRSNATIVQRGNIAIIDFEGKSAKFEELRLKIENKNLWYLAVPSQSNKADKLNERYHIIYLLNKPFSINAAAMREQAKDFFNFIDFKWNEKSSGIDTTATFVASSYFSPTIQLKDKKSTNNNLKEKYRDFDDVYKDSYISPHRNSYKITAPMNENENVVYNDIQASFLDLDLKEKPKTKILRKTNNGYLLSKDSLIKIGDNKYASFEDLVTQLEKIDSENPRISQLGCPIQNPNHEEPEKLGYSFLQYDENRIPYITCTGNACNKHKFYTMARGNIEVRRVDNRDGSFKYVMFQDDLLIYSNKQTFDYKFSPQAIADELYNQNQFITDKSGSYNRNLTIAKFVIGTEAIQITNNPFQNEGKIDSQTYNISPKTRFEPTPEAPNYVVSKAIKSFDNDMKYNSYPISLIYLAYYIFHYEKISAVLALVNNARGSGKSFWALELPSWYLKKVGNISNSSIEAGWEDDKLNTRLVVYEDVDGLDKRTIAKLRGDIKNQSTSENGKLLNIKGQSQIKSVGYNMSITTNKVSQIPFDGENDRRIYCCEYIMSKDAKFLATQFALQSENCEENRRNAINFLYKIYKDCPLSSRLKEFLYYKVPKSTIRNVVKRATMGDAKVAVDMILTSKNLNEAVEKLENLIVCDIDIKDLDNLKIFYSDHHVIIPMTTLSKLWTMIPTGFNSIKNLNNRQLCGCFGLEEQNIKKFKFGKGIKCELILS